MTAVPITPDSLEGKQRELQHRDELHLEIARTIFLEEGYHSLTISRLAKATGSARRTLYERFHCKEELLVARGLRWSRLAAPVRRMGLRRHRAPYRFNRACIHETGSRVKETGC